jgi:hypothetical protein
MNRFWNYVGKVFDIGSLAASLTDARREPQIPTATVWLSALGMATGRLGSLNALEQVLARPTGLQGLLGPRRPSADTVGRVMGLMDVGPVRQSLVKACHQLRRNKVLDDNPWPLRFAVLDGHEFIHTESCPCCQCSLRTFERDGQSVTQYYHRGVVAYLIGFSLAIPLDVEMQRPGEGEMPAARRLLERLVQTYARFFDAVVCDSLYLERPFVDACRQHQKHILAVLKENNPALLRDAEGLFAKQAPVVRIEDGRTIRYWDEEGFTSSSTITIPLRILHVEEIETKRKTVGGAQRVETETHSWWWATTIPQSVMPARQLRHVGHGRWHIENRLFHTLTTYWGLDHAYHHHPVAIVNFVLTLLLGFLLTQAFYYRNLKEPARTGLSLLALTRFLLAETFPQTLRASRTTAAAQPP